MQKGFSYSVGWLTAIAWQVYVAGSCFMAGTLIQGLIALNDPDYVFQRWHGTLLAIGIVVFSVTYNILLSSRLPVLAQIVLVLHIAGVFVTVIPLWITATKGNASEVLLQFQDNGGWGNKGLSAMIGFAPLGVFNGYDCIAHMCKWIIARFRKSRS